MKDEPLQERTAVERLTRATCTFAEHVDRDGIGWSHMRHDDVCAVLGELERLQALVGRLEGALRRVVPDCCLGITNYNGTGQPCPGNMYPDEPCCIARQALLVEGGG